MAQDTESPAVYVLLFLIVITAIGTIVFSLATRTTSVTQRSEASEKSSTTCPVTAHVFIHEVKEDGTEAPIVFSEAGSDAFLWGFADTINLPPYEETVIPFNVPGQTEYRLNTQDLTLSLNASSDQVYPSEQDISVTALIDDANYEILRREIRNCSFSDNDIWLCGRQDPNMDPHTISGISMRCGMDLDFGWVVQRRDEPVSPVTSFSDSSPIQFITADLNRDGVINATDLTIVIESYGSIDPVADVNIDGKVNVLDFSLVSEAIMSQTGFDNALERDL